MSTERRLARRLFGKATDVTLSIAKFETLEKVNLNARAIDISNGGLCIESTSPLEPGFVWFRDGLGKQKGGVVIWSKELTNNTCRAGIQFVPINQYNAECGGKEDVRPPLPSWSDPGLVVSMLVDEVPSTKS